MTFLYRILEFIKSWIEIFLVEQGKKKQHSSKTKKLVAFWEGDSFEVITEIVN